MSDERPTIEESYGSAIRSSNLRSVERTSRSASDILGAAGFASRMNPLAIALLRVFVGDGRASAEVVDILVSSLTGKAYRMGVEIGPVETRDMACAVLAWHRDGTCKPCGGLGYIKIDGSPSLSEHRCVVCHGTGRMPFEAQFREDWRDLARWILTEIEREQAIVGPAAMRALAPRLEI
jgi:hypothetical protein